MSPSGASGSNNNDEGQPAVVVVALSSAVAGIVARLCTHPLDTIKARLQAPGLSLSRPDSGGGHNGTIREVWRHSSWRSLYRGLSVALVGGTPGTVLYLTTYEQLKRGSDGGDGGTTTSFTTHFLAGLAAEAVACSIYVPVDVVKERLQVGMYETPTMALSTIFRVNNDGQQQQQQRSSSITPLRTLYRGYWATLASFGPYSAFYFLFYEESKRLARETQYYQSQPQEQQQQLSFWWILTCSAGSGAAASFITSPLDLIKLRLQLQNSSDLPAARRQQEGVGGTGSTGGGIRYEFNQVYRSAGLRGLFRGAGARVLHFVPATTIAMTTYETCLRTFSNNHLPRG